MSNNYKSTLQSNNAKLSSNNLDLQSLIDQANALPEAGGATTVSVTISGVTVYGFDADGNSLTVSNGTYDFLSGIVLSTTALSSASGTYVNVGGAGGARLYKFFVDGGSVYRDEGSN